MIWPLRSTNLDKSARVSTTRPVTLVSITVCSRSHSVSESGVVGGASPALLSSKSISPHGASSRARLSTASRSRMSICSGRKASPNSSCSRFRRSPRRPVPIARQPPATNLRAAASPNPDVAPVIRMVFICFLPRVRAAPLRELRASRQAPPKRTRDPVHAPPGSVERRQATPARQLGRAAHPSRFRSGR
jgi:hypothetical protein